MVIMIMAAGVMERKGQKPGQRWFPRLEGAAYFTLRNFVCAIAAAACCLHDASPAMWGCSLPNPSVLASEVSHMLFFRWCLIASLRSSVVRCSDWFAVTSLRTAGSVQMTRAKIGTLAADNMIRPLVLADISCLNNVTSGPARPLVLISQCFEK
jgi:hypothetical protein